MPPRSTLEQARCAPARIGHARTEGTGLRPPESDQILATRVVGRNPSLELGQIPRIILHEEGHYRLGSSRPEKPLK